LAALAQDTRLAVFRLLIRQAPEGLPAGRVAAEVGVAPATLSFHLAQLERAGLLTADRRGRQIYYAAHPEGIRGLLSFLTEDCCGGRPELCGGFGANPTVGERVSKGTARDRKDETP
jgi:DNA-binding transcriptional ArsR family regulator